MVCLDSRNKDIEEKDVRKAWSGVGRIVRTAGNVIEGNDVGTTCNRLGNNGRTRSNERKADDDARKAGNALGNKGKDVRIA